MFGSNQNTFGSSNAFGQSGTLSSLVSLTLIDCGMFLYFDQKRQNNVKSYCFFLNKVNKLALYLRL